MMIDDFENAGRLKLADVHTTFLNPVDESDPGAAYSDIVVDSDIVYIEGEDTYTYKEDKDE
jgi:hypothetical protein